MPVDTHTPPLVNGRRIADFPLPFGGRSNFTDVSSLPLGMIDRIEVLTGSASAIYGSDAIAGVVNFILKRDLNGVRADVQYGFAFHDNNNDAARQIVQDAGYGFSIPAFVRSSWISLIGSLVLTVMVWLIVITNGGAA